MPGKLNFGSAGTGSFGQFCSEMLKLQSGIEMMHVPYRGSSAAVTDLAGGQIQVMFDPLVLSQKESGRVRVLAMTAPERSRALSGYSDHEGSRVRPISIRSDGSASLALPVCRRTSCRSSPMPRPRSRRIRKSRTAGGRRRRSWVPSAGRVRGDARALQGQVRGHRQARQHPGRAITRRCRAGSSWKDEHMSEGQIRYEAADGIALITIDRPAKRNALDVGDVCRSVRGVAAFCCQ